MKKFIIFDTIFLPGTFKEGILKQNSTRSYQFLMRRLAGGVEVYVCCRLFHFPRRYAICDCIPDYSSENRFDVRRELRGRFLSLEVGSFGE